MTVGRRTASSSSATRARRRAGLKPPWTTMGSAIEAPAVRRGLREEAGFWWTTPVARRAGSSARRRARATSTPHTRTLPEATGTRPVSVPAIVDLPEPDSPTSPRTSPGAILREASRTAWTVRRPLR